MSTEVKVGLDRSFGLVFSAVFAMIGLAPLVHGNALRLWSLAVAVIFLLFSLIKPELLAPLNRGWAHFGLRLNQITTPIIMSILFFVAVTPTGLLMRLFGKRPLQLSYEPKAPSYWIARQNPDTDSMKRPF